jgi:hypothetical protein
MAKPASAAKKASHSLSLDTLRKALRLAETARAMSLLYDEPPLAQV